MNNILSYLSIGKRLGEQLILPFSGASFTAEDGSVWKVNNLKVFPYTSDYSQLATECPNMVTSAVQLPGDLTSGNWDLITNLAITAIVGSGTWLAVTNDTTYYLTSADSGATWTKRAYPVAGKTWTPLWDGTNFVLYANGTGATGVQESTDGISWTAQTAISITTVQDVIYNGTLYLAFPRNGTTASTSTDRTTWTSRTLNATSVSQVFKPGMGSVTWNAGAGMFIASTTTAYAYQKSTDGATWSAGTFPSYWSHSSITALASDATTTVAISACGKCITTTDGTNWTERTIDTELSLMSGTVVPQFLYHDGTRFVTSYYGTLYYSTDGATWTKSVRGNLGASTNLLVFKTPNGIGNLPTNSQFALNLTDPTSTAKTNIIGWSTSNLTSFMTYVRIK